MEMLLPWQQADFTTTQQSESILNSQLAHLFFVTIRIIDLSGCYENTVIRD